MLAQTTMKTTKAQRTEPSLVAEDLDSGAAGRWWQRARWRWAGGAFLLGVLYTATVVGIGAQLRVGALDVTLLAGGVIEVSFAAFGFLVGLTREARARERAAATAMRANLEALADAQRRLAQAEKLASLGALAGAIAHEVRNPLAILRAQLQNLEEALPAGTAGARRSVAELLEEIDRLAHVTSSLVDFARPPVLDRRAVTASAVLSRVHALGRQMLRPLPVRLTLRAGASRSSVAAAPVLDADADLLCQVLLGLVENAAAAMPAGGEVSLAARSELDCAILEVSDTGPGVPAELRERIFEPFFTTRPGGAGLGLAVARHIVRAHGGELSVEAAPGGGARFEIALPAHDREERVA